MTRFIIVIPVLLVACSSPYQAAWRGVYGVKKAAEISDQALAAALKAKTADCLAKHGSKTADYATCVRAFLAAARKWVRYARPGIQSALSAAVDSIKIAESAKAKIDPRAMVRDVGCLLLRSIKPFRAELQKAAPGVSAALIVVEAIGCKAP